MSTITTIPYYKIFNKQTGRSQTVSNRKSIQDNLTMLYLTSKGELLGDPDYGTNIKKYVINNRGMLLQDRIKEDIVNATFKYEKRVLLSEDDVIINENFSSDPNYIEIRVQYTIKETGEIDYIELSLNGEDL